ncbi:uncharacterized protein LOC110811684 [Carica papaya]|uniref:uncharacterized protein LOC110811684 n=1 Tax=Carica papaya TaxID=3649 RepID=UPI000B8D1A43|nr:uncharacterized protein LOC110811684 [Carica papaya]
MASQSLLLESSGMDPPATDVEHVPEKIENGKEGGPSFRCDLYDTEVVHKIAQVFLSGLATASIDNTTGDIFRSPGSVAAEIRKEMVDYLTQRSETFVAERVVLEGGPEAEASDHPFDIISDFIDDFATTKRNLFSRVSGWLLSEKREDKIDDFVQEMEVNGFWLTDRREGIAQILLKNVDFKNEYHCSIKFNTPEQLAEHVLHCGYRPLNCTNEGCTARFCASQMEKHDSVCPFKIILCDKVSKRIEQLEKSSSARLVRGRDARSLTYIVKDLDAKLGPLEIKPRNKVNEEDTEKVDMTEEAEESKTQDQVNKENTEKSHLLEEAESKGHRKANEENTENANDGEEPESKAHNQVNIENNAYVAGAAENKPQNEINEVKEGAHVAEGAKDEPQIKINEENTEKARVLEGAGNKDLNKVDEENKASEENMKKALVPEEAERNA